MSARRWLAATAVLLTICVGLEAQARNSVRLYVKETAGIRRFGYPVNARVPFSKGLLPSATNVRLLLNETETPAQYAAESRWPDGSIQWLAVDFNATIGPKEVQTYRLEYGDGITAEAIPRGLALNEDADAIQAGNFRFSKTGKPLLLSVKYRGEGISSGLNGIAVTDAAGVSHDLTSVEALKVEIVKRGPLYVVIKYSGRMFIDAQYRVPFEITVEMPNSKSWVKISATVEDAAKRLRELSFHTPFSFGPLPLIWDFGTGHWTYGTLRTPLDSVTLTQVVKTPGTADWNVATGPKGKEQSYESAERAEPARWGHIQDAKEAVAFAIQDLGRQAGTYRVTLDGDGQASFRFAPAQPATRHHLTVYEHFVSTPVQIGAATTPASILNPLIAECERTWYILSGVQPPSNAEDVRRMRLR
jgi:hypothetical protein